MLAPRCSGGGRRRPGPRARLLAGSLAVCPPARLRDRCWALRDPAICCSPAPGSVFIGARAPRSLCETLCAKKKKTQYHVWGVKPGRKTKPQAAAAQAGSWRRGAGGGGRGGGRENRAGGGAGIGLAVQVVRADCGESWWLPAGARAQVREASTLPRRAWTGNCGA